MTETPPRAWGRLLHHVPSWSEGGNTPTGVGKTLCGPGRLGIKGKHPHGRGEDSAAGVRLQLVEETPPRAWGRHREVPNGDPVMGNTPTGVGKTRSG